MQSGRPPRLDSEANVVAISTVAIVGLLIWFLLAMATFNLTNNDDLSWGVRIFWIVFDTVVAYLAARGLYATGVDLSTRVNARRWEKEQQSRRKAEFQERHPKHPSTSHKFEPDGRGGFLCAYCVEEELGPWTD